MDCRIKMTEFCYCLQMYIFLINNKKNSELLPNLTCLSIIFSTFASQQKNIFVMKRAI